MKKVMFVLLGLLAIVSCKDDDDKVGPASEAEMQEVTGHWYAELPISGEIENWRTEEEGDMTTYDKIYAVIYLNGYINEPVEDGYSSYWGYLYINNDGEMVNYGGVDVRKNSTLFSFTMDSEGYIKPSSQIANLPQVSNIRYKNGVITADVDYHGSTIHATFLRPDDLFETTLKDYYDILFEEGIVGGYEDDDSQQYTDVHDNPANEPSRSNTAVFKE